MFYNVNREVLKLYIKISNKILRKLRYVAGLSQRELGEKIGVSQEAVSRYESGSLSISKDKENEIIGVLMDSGLSKTDISLLVSVLDAGNL